MERPIKEENPNESELKSWIEKSGYPLKKFFNTSGKLYKDLNLKTRGFKFLGSTIIYAHLQATGLINDHLVGCFKYD